MKRTRVNNPAEHQQQQQEFKCSHPCVHCRDAHKKCDRLLPTCSTCTKRNLQCFYATGDGESSTKRAKWVQSGDGGSGSGGRGNVMGIGAVAAAAATSMTCTTARMEDFHDRDGTHHHLSSVQHHQQQHYQYMSCLTAPSSVQQQPSLPPPMHMHMPSPFLNQVAANDATHNILDLCFKIHQPDNTQLPLSEFKSIAINQFLCYKLGISSAVNFCSSISNQRSSISPEELEFKADLALWFAVQAVILHSLPTYGGNDASSGGGVVNQDLVNPMLESACICLISNAQDLPIIIKALEVDDFHTRVANLPYAQVLETAKQMFHFAKSIILDTRIFPHIGSHMKLAQASAGLVSYLLIIGESFEEARLFMTPIKVYTSKIREYIDSPLCVNDSTKKEQGELARRFDRLYIHLRVGLWYNQKYSSLFSKKLLNKFLRLISKVVPDYFQLQPSEAAKFNHDISVLRHTFGEDGRHVNLTQLQDLAQKCQHMRKQAICTNIIHNSLWKLILYTLQIFAVESASTTEMNHLSTAGHRQELMIGLERAKLNLANEISNQVLSLISVVLLGGAYSLNILQFASKVHLDYSMRLCSVVDNHTDGKLPADHMKQMQECLAFLHTDIVVLETLYNKHGIQQCKVLFDQIKPQRQIHLGRFAIVSQMENKNNSPTPTPQGLETFSEQQSLQDSERTKQDGVVDVFGDSAANSFYDEFSVQQPELVDHPLLLSAEDNNLMFSLFDWDTSGNF